jgi:RNA polymerase sigma-70 factor (ECF subfamily)
MTFQQTPADFAIPAAGRASGGLRHFPALHPAPDPRDELVTHLASLHAFAMSLTRNAATAEDLVQDTLVKALAHFDGFTPGTNMRAWLFTILRNTFYSLRRKRRNEVEDPDGQHAATLCDMPIHMARLEFGEFQRAFRHLSAEHREVLTLVGASGYSIDETASMIGVAAGTVKSRTNRARSRLAELMGRAAEPATASSPH